MQKKMMSDGGLRRLVLSALLLAIGLAVKQFSIMIPIMGVGGLRVGFSGIFTSIPAILFGPLYGGLTSGLSDLIGYILKPEGAWVPQLTLTAVLGGVMRGFIWKWIRDCSLKRTGVVLSGFLVALIIFGTVNQTAILFYPDSNLAGFLTKLTSKGQSQVFFATYLPVLAGTAGLVMLIINYFIDKRLRKSDANRRYLTIAVTFLITGLVITTINTFILMDVYQIKKAFLIFYIPRFVEEVSSTMINAYVVSLLLPKITHIKF